MTADGIASIIVAVTGLLGAIAALVVAIRTNTKTAVNSAHIDNIQATQALADAKIHETALKTPAAPTVNITAGTGQDGGGTE